jgi:uncharacterized membrane protein YhdT
VKQGLLKILTTYLYIGATIGTIQVLSWIFYGIPMTLYYEFSTVFSLGGFIGFCVSFFMHCILNPIIVMFTWLPSVISVFSDDSSITIIQYLLPGGFDYLISKG